MAAPFALRVCQRPVHCFLKLKPLVCFIKSPSPCLGGSLVHACCFGTSAVDNASELLPMTSGFQNKFERQRQHHHGVGGRWHCSVWPRGKQAQIDSMHTLRSYYWMVHTRSFKTKRSAGQTPDTSDDITDEVEGSQYEYRQPTAGSGSSHSANSAWLLRFSNDNSYASFCRNAYLSVIVAFTVLLDRAPTVIFAREVCVLFLMIGFTQITYGTVGFMYATIYLRQQMFMSRTTAIAICSMALAHFLLWICAVIIFLSDGGTDDNTYDYQDLDTTDNAQVLKWRKE